MKSRRPYSCSKHVLRELNSFLMKTLSFVLIHLHRCRPREWKRSKERFHMTSSRPSWCFKFLCEIFLVPINLHRHWPREWKLFIFMVLCTKSRDSHRLCITCITCKILQKHFIPEYFACKWEKYCDHINSHINYRYKISWRNNVVTLRKVGTCRTQRTPCLSTSVVSSGCDHDLTRVMRMYI